MKRSPICINICRRLERLKSIRLLYKFSKPFYGLQNFQCSPHPNKMYCFSVSRRCLSDSILLEYSKMLNVCLAHTDWSCRPKHEIDMMQGNCTFLSKSPNSVIFSCQNIHWSFEALKSDCIIKMI